MTDRYQPLRDAIAAGPTKGPWRVSAGVVDNPRLIVEDDIGLAVCAMSLRGVHGDRRKMGANADFIAAADPDTIAALLAERDALRRENALLRSGIDLDGEYLDGLALGMNLRAVPEQVGRDMAQQAWRQTA